MRIIPSRNHVMAAERIPAAYRPSNQARLEPARASNPSLAEADAYLPESDEVRYGNSRGDNGLSLRYDMTAPWAHRTAKRWGRSAEQRLPSAQAVPLTTEMENITGAPPQQLQAPQAQLLTTPIVSAGAAGMGTFASRLASQVQAVRPHPGVHLMPLTFGGKRPLPQGMTHVNGTPMTGLVKPPITRISAAMVQKLRAAGDTRVPFMVMSRAGTSGLGALDNPSLWLAGGCVLGLFLLMRARTTAH